MNFSIWFDIEQVIINDKSLAIQEDIEEEMPKDEENKESEDIPEDKEVDEEYLEQLEKEAAEEKKKWEENCILTENPDTGDQVIQAWVYDIEPNKNTRIKIIAKVVEDAAERIATDIEMESKASVEVRFGGTNPKESNKVIHYLKTTNVEPELPPAEEPEYPGAKDPNEPTNPDNPEDPDIRITQITQAIQVIQIVQVTQANQTIRKTLIIQIIQVHLKQKLIQ